MKRVKGFLLVFMAATVTSIPIRLLNYIVKNKLWNGIMNIAFAFLFCYLFCIVYIHQRKKQKQANDD